MPPLRERLINCDLGAASENCLNLIPIENNTSQVTTPLHMVTSTPKKACSQRESDGTYGPSVSELVSTLKTNFDKQGIELFSTTGKYRFIVLDNVVLLIFFIRYCASSSKAAKKCTCATRK